MIKRSLNLETYLNQLTEEASVSTSSHACKRKGKKNFLLSMPAITSPWNERAPAVMVDRWSKADLYA